MYQEISYSGYEEASLPRPLPMQTHLGLTLPNLPRLFVLNEEGFRPKVLGADLRLLLFSLIHPFTPGLMDFARDPILYGFRNPEDGDLFVRKNSQFTKNHELAHTYIDFKNKGIEWIIYHGDRPFPPTEKPFATLAFVEGLADLIAIETGLKMADPKARNEAVMWRNYRLSGQTRTDEFLVDSKFLSSQQEKMARVVNEYIKDAAAVLEIRVGQFNKALKNLHSNSKKMDKPSSYYSVGLAYCMASFRKLLAQGLESKEAMDKLILNPPQTLDMLKTPLEELSLLTA